jgi:hypothetical protein
MTNLFNSQIPIPEHLIGTHESRSSLRDGHCGYTETHRKADTPQALRDACGDAARDFPSSMWIEAKDRPARAALNDESRTWAMNYVSGFTNQGPGGEGYSTHECTCHDLIQNFRVARNKQRGMIYKDGPKVGYRYPESAKGDVFFSPLSVYAEANPGERGGAGCIQVLNIACRRGILPDKTQPRDYGFRHTLHGTCGKGGINQSRGPWTPLSKFPEGWQETAGLFKPEEVVVTTNWEEALCLILWGYKCSYGRNGHAVGPGMWNAASNAFPYPDSYDVIRVDPFSTFKNAVSMGAYFILSVKPPDDWLNPAGVLAA